MPDSTTTPTPDSRGAILIADDDLEFNNATAAFLTAHGYHCRSVADAASAAAALRENSYDLLLSDIDMPGNKSLELIADLPRLQPGLRAILLTGRPTFGTAAKSIELHVSAYLIKPPEPQDLLQKVDQGVVRYRGYQTVAAQRRKLQ